MSDALADAFLMQFLNRGWRPSMRAGPDIRAEFYRKKGEYYLRPLEPQDADRKAFAWLSKHPSFSRLLPRVGIGFPDAARTVSAGEALARFSTQRAWLRWIWSENSDLIPTAWARKTQMADYVYAYSVSAGSFRPQTRTRLSPWAQFTAAPIGSWPLPDPFYAVLLRAWAVAFRMRMCDNPDCRHPFSLAGRETQKFCSAKCAEPSERRRKLRWWRKHGKKWRASRRRKPQRREK